MRSLFFAPDIQSAGDTYQLAGDEGRHAQTVMRIGVGEEITLTDFAGNYADGTVISTSKGALELRLTKKSHQPAPSQTITLIQALVKNDRLKEMLELVVASGADAITPWAATNCIGKWQEDSSKKWQQHVLAAAKQTRRIRQPEINELITSKNLSQLTHNFDLILVADEMAEQKLSSLADQIEGATRIAVVIGPEGGISESELTALAASGAKVISLGAQVFRAAHAAIAAVSAVAAIVGRI